MVRCQELPTIATASQIFALSSSCRPVRVAGRVAKTPGVKPDWLQVAAMIKHTLLFFKKMLLFFKKNGGGLSLANLQKLWLSQKGISWQCVHLCECHRKIQTRCWVPATPLSPTWCLCHFGACSGNCSSNLVSSEDSYGTWGQGSLMLWLLLIGSFCALSWHGCGQNAIP